MKKYPDAAQFPHNGLKIKPPKFFLTYKDGRRIPLSQVPGKLGRRLGILKTRLGMNPGDHWYASNDTLRNYLDDYMATNVAVIANEELRNDTLNLYHADGLLEGKVCALSLIGTLKLLEG